MSMRMGSRRALGGLDDMNNTSMSHIPEDTTFNGGFRQGRSSSTRVSRPLQDMNHSHPQLYRKTSNTKRSHPNLRMSIVDPTEDGVVEPTVKDKYAKIRPASDCRPMEKAERMQRNAVRFISQNLMSLFGRAESQLSSSSSHKQSSAEDASIATTTIHGRMEVRTRNVRSLSAPKNPFGEEGVTGIDDSRHNQPNGGHHLEYEITTQFRLSTQKSKETFASRILAMIGISTSGGGIYDDAGGNSDDINCCGIEPNKLVTSYLHWTFRQSFMAVFLSAAVGFFGLTLFFGLLIFWFGTDRPECIYVDGEIFSNYTGSSSYRSFGDAYQLSWNSFATVGYGIIYPATSATNHDPKSCAGIMFICSVESFVGVLFGSFCGAIMFGKVARVRSIAQVSFSDGVVVRYGTGITGHISDTMDDQSDKSGSNGSADTEKCMLHELPCPVLEFRIANRMHGTVGGEIMDCSMNIVASIDGSKVDQALRKAAIRRRRRKGKRVPRRTNFPVERLESLSSSDHKGDTIEKLANMLREEARKPPRAPDEDPFGKIASKQIFSKLEVETPDHPFFKRVWTARHTLDLESPILAEEAKQAIRLNNGFWPKELNDAESVRACMNLDQILVSFSGTSNADANSVYAQKVYDFHDISIGYRFVNMMYHESDGSLKVDLANISDVVEQIGGGGEPLEPNQPRFFSELLVL